jgi:hypothetical protein
MPPEHVPMNSTEITSEAAIEERTQDLLGRVPVLRQRFQELVSTPSFDPSSAAAIDQRDALGHHVWECALHALGAADDLIETWRQVHVANIRPATGHIVLLRTVLETTTLTRWLVDLNLASPERVRRGVLAHLADCDERARFEAVFDRSRITFTPPAKSGQERVEELLAECRQRELRVTNRNGEPLRPASATERCRLYAHAPGFGGEAAYRVSSAFAHGQQWTLPFLTRELHPEMSTPTDAVITKVTFHPGVMAVATYWGVMTFAAALNDLVRYIQPTVAPSDLGSPIERRAPLNRRQRRQARRKIR